MRRVLILTYYWPPAGGAGVQRWLKFSKYLPEFGWDPVIYTSKDAEYPATDLSLQKDVRPETLVLRTKPWEPYDLYKRMTGRKKSEKVSAGFISEGKKPGPMQKLAVWIRGNYFIPDARRFWIKPSIEFLSDWLQKNKVDAIISTGPPHSMHLIALGLKRKFGIPWIADFRDPWTNIDFYDQLMLSAAADARHRRLEQEVLQHADKIVTVSRHWAGDFRKLSNRSVEVIANGYDEEDFNVSCPEVKKEFAFHHIGALNKDRNPVVFWKALAEVLKVEPELKHHLKIRLVGKTDYSVFESLKGEGLWDFVERIDYLPHSEIVPFLMSSPVLLLPLNDTPNVLGIIPGKLFEYLAAKRPVVCIGNPDGDSAEIIRECLAGSVHDFKDLEGMIAMVQKYFSEYKSGVLSMRMSNDISRFSRRNGAKAFAMVLEKL
ncbi:MAG: glycosyltransferase family 4 protein [Bacteroidia bacterium]|nr:glycosyltransferase family 4 protein [Bacteroidia bacterium]